MNPSRRYRDREARVTVPRCDSELARAAVLVRIWKVALYDIIMISRNHYDIAYDIICLELSMIS